MSQHKQVGVGETGLSQSRLMQAYPKRACLLAGAVMLSLVSGCGLIQDRSDEYRNAPAGDPIKVPDWQSKARIQPVYAVRDADAGDAVAQGEFSVPEPPDMTSEILDENYVVEELNGQVWLLVNEVPGRVWPMVSSYLTERGLGVARENPQIGLLQTDIANYSQRARSLLALSGEDASSDLTLVQSRIAPGVRRKTTEIQFRIRKEPARPDAMLQWPSETTVMAQEKELLADLGNYLKEREDTKSYSRAALSIPSAPKVKLVSGQSDDPHIEMELSFDRAWSEVNRALSEADIPLVDIDRSAGQFYVDYRSEEELESGWFDWFADPPKPEYTYLVTIRQDGDVVSLRTQVAPDYDGDNRSARLLSELFEYLY
ncbi:outer membrane protein assembly factor BamC [Marinobacter fonticola]|uniref:outer membrane protein assembly factor BamC n=1 Tax=Marinobacter fonticola TaxID=2603215 RepID=UPI001D0DB9D5|nr:outer membrane protein assembly factor BamC [Marinobacter fonticola]